MIELEKVTKRFKSVEALSNVSLRVEEGETLALFGPSGAGKTVLLRAIAGLVEPDGGRVFLHGENMADVQPEDRGVGMAFQNFALFPHMSAFDNIASPLTARRMPVAALTSAVHKVAELLKIRHVVGHSPRALSNGQKQRTALARALVAGPPVLLLDDPLRNVDAKLRFEMRLELPRLLSDRRAATIYVTQDFREAMALGQRIAVLIDGRIAQIGVPDAIYHRPATLQIARLFGDPVINTLEVTPEADGSGIFARLSETRVPLAPGFAHAVGRACLLGLRPEAVKFVENTRSGAIPVTVEVETPLNEKTVTLMVTKRGREILASRPAGTPGPASGPAHIAFETTRALLFDRDTAERIGSADEPDARAGAAA